MTDVDFFTPGARLALELECLLMDTRNTAAQSRWWDSAHEALEQWRQAVRAMEAADAVFAKENVMNESIPEAVVEAVARAICVACEENPDRKGDTARAAENYDALRKLEERVQRDEDLLRQALEALEVYAEYDPEGGGVADNAIAALRERLGKRTEHKQ